jgi:membrane fusion protein (multidrug efflux system)
VVQTYTHILTLIDPSALNAEVYVSEMLLSEIGVGDVVDIRIDALRDHTYKGRISRIHPVIDPQSRQGLVEITLQPPPKGARPGQLARITISTDKTAGLVIPFSALRHDNAGPFVYRIEADDIARRNPVRTGLQIGDRIEILEGLSEGDRVIVSGLIRVSDGKKVRIVNEEGLETDQTVLVTPKSS